MITGALIALGVALPGVFVICQYVMGCDYDACRRHGGRP